MIFGDVRLNYNNMLFNVTDYATKVAYFNQKQSNLTLLNESCFSINKSAVFVAAY